MANDYLRWTTLSAVMSEQSNKNDERNWHAQEKE